MRRHDAKTLETISFLMRAALLFLFERQKIKQIEKEKEIKIKKKRK